jgi:NAD+ synthase
MENLNRKITNYTSLKNSIVNWLKEYAENAGANGFVIGVSGGVDSAVVSTLCAETGLNLLVLEMPIHQGKDQVTRAQSHISWLKESNPNVSSLRVDLTDAYNMLYKTFENQAQPVTEEQFNFSMANTRSRLRMLTLYQYAGTHKMLVAGTGNKVEDFGIGFYTKYGDGGVDISPIADLMKSEVRELGHMLGVSDEIINATPTDGLHSDGRTDEDQIGATYDELEWAMGWIEEHMIIEQGVGRFYDESEDYKLNDRQKEVLEIYENFNNSNKHKMVSIPVFITENYREKWRQLK